jgi:hypothetical protein
MRLSKLESVNVSQVEAAVSAGGRLVFYEYCISFIALTLRRPSALYLLEAGDRGFVHGIPYALASLILGWWGLPWGLVYTPLVLLTDLAGGCDVTEEIMSRLRGTGSPENSTCGP